MKAKVVFAISIFAFLISCHSGNEQQSVSVAETDFKHVAISLPFSGCWISEAYLNTIKSTGSPRLAQMGVMGCYTEIPDSTLKPVYVAYNFHQGGGELTFVKHGNKFELWDFYQDQLHDSVRSFEVLSANRIRIDTTVFVKVHDSLKDTFRILESILFKGKYTAQNGNIVEFKNNGEVSGLDTFRHYDPQIDYEDEGMQVDQVGLSVDDRYSEFYAFKFNKDTLQLHKLKCLQYDSANHTCGVVDFGELVYKLVKKK